MHGKIAQTNRVSFDSHGTRCAAWVTYPDGERAHPAVVLIHGLGANHQMMLRRYEQALAGAGIATLAFDYRNTGESEGNPRQRIAMRRQHKDVAAALEFLQADRHIDANRVGLWGTSLGAMHALRMAAERPDVAAVVVQCPIVHGPGAVLHSGIAPPASHDDAHCAGSVASRLQPAATIRAHRGPTRLVGRRDGTRCRRGMELDRHRRSDVRQPNCGGQRPGARDDQRQEEGYANQSSCAGVCFEA